MAVTLQPIDRDKWQLLASSFWDYNYRQLWDFGVACAKRLKATSEHVAIYDGTELVGLADVRIKRIPFLKIGIAYINGGPMVRSSTNSEEGIKRLQVALAGLTETYVRQKRLVLRIQPNLGSDGWNDLQSRTFQDLGYVIGTQQRFYRTLVLDISQLLKDIRKQLNQKWRNCLNNAEKRNLTVRTGADETYFSVFMNLYKELIYRKDFDVDLNPEFYLHVQESLVEHERFLVTIVHENDQPVAGHVSSILGDTCVYLLGATNDAGLKNKAAYLAQWSVIQTAKERGCSFYDLGGIDPDKNPGVYHFKKGLGGIDMTAPGPFELYPDGFRRLLVTGCEKAFKIVRRLRIP